MKLYCLACESTIEVQGNLNGDFHLNLHNFMVRVHTVSQLRA
jgi:hypothetical protein